MKALTKEQSTSPDKNRLRCRKKFLYYFPKGFNDQKYLDWERNYKWHAHLMWEEQLNQKDYEQLLTGRKYGEIALRAARIETKTNLLFSFEKMALRDAIKTEVGAKLFAKGLYNYVYGSEAMKYRFDDFVKTLEALPRRQTRVLTWPLQTVFGFLADPHRFIFLKPRVTKIAAEKYHFNFSYRSRPNWETYKSFMEFAEQVREDTADLRPKDFVDLQSFIWVLGSDEYPE